MIDQAYEVMTSKDKEAFSGIINRLLKTNYILREVYSPKEQGMKVNYDFRFLERHYALVEDYLYMGGWQLNKDSRFGVIYITSIYEHNRQRLNKFTTMILLTLRLIYDEEREKLSLKKEILLTVGDLVHKMISLGLVDRKPSKQDLTRALGSLAGFHLIERFDGLFSEAETRFVIYPSILFVLTNARLNELYSLIEDEEKETTDFETEDQLMIGDTDEDI